MEPAERRPGEAKVGGNPAERVILDSEGNLREQCRAQQRRGRAEGPSKTQVLEQVGHACLHQDDQNSGQVRENRS